MIKFETIPNIEIGSKDIIIKSHNLPELVHLDDPALSVMIDFCQTPAFTLDEDTSMFEAHHEMEFHGTHLMFVTDEHNHVKGLLTAEDLLGEKPIKVIEETRSKRHEIPVRMLMTKLKHIPAFDITAIEKARVGNVLSSLHKLDEAVAIVVRKEESQTILRGCFTTSQISRQLHLNVRKRIHDMDSISELKDWKK